jgi:hypothetical protein
MSTKRTGIRHPIPGKHPFWCRKQFQIAWRGPVHVNMTHLKPEKYEEIIFSEENGFYSGPESVQRGKFYFYSVGSLFDLGVKVEKSNEWVPPIQGFFM